MSKDALVLGARVCDVCGDATPLSDVFVLVTGPTRRAACIECLLARVVTSPDLETVREAALAALHRDGAV